MRHTGSILRVLGEDGGVISASLGFSVFETMQDEPTRVFMTGQYRAKIALTADGPRFQELLVMYDTSLIPGLLVFPI
jgi:3-phenylpropionate/cinnamic acid dioxygenase small subunit